MPVTPPGIFTTGDAIAAGWSEGAIARNVRSGRWRRLYRGVYARADMTLSAVDRAMAVHLATGGAASHTTAARCHGLWVVDGGEWAIVPMKVHRPARDGLRLQRADLLDAEVVQIAGVPVTSLSRTLLDLAKRSSRLQAVAAIESAVRLGRVNCGDLASLREHADNRLRSRALVTDPRSESPLETATRLILHDAGVDVVPQWVVEDWRGWTGYRIDLAIPELRIAIECDGTVVHGSVQAVYRDRSRANSLNVDGWHVLRFTWWDVTNRPDYIVATVRNAIVRRQRAAG